MKKLFFTVLPLIVGAAIAFSVLSFAGGSAAQTPQQYLQSLFPNTHLAWHNVGGAQIATVPADGLTLSVQKVKTQTDVVIGTSSTQLQNLANPQAAVNKIESVIVQASEHFTGSAGAFNVVAGFLFQSFGIANGPNHVVFAAVAGP